MFLQARLHQKMLSKLTQKKTVNAQKSYSRIVLFKYILLLNSATTLVLHNTCNFRALKFFPEELSYLSWWTESLVWTMPPAWQPYYCYNPAAQNRTVCSRVCPQSSHKQRAPAPKPSAKFQACNTGNMLTPNVCRIAPLKASISRMKPPLVDMRMSLPSLLNFRPVHSHVRSYCILNVANGPFKEKMGNTMLILYALLLTRVCF